MEFFYSVALRCLNFPEGTHLVCSLPNNLQSINVY
jgi:hypothetical protein